MKKRDIVSLYLKEKKIKKHFLKQKLRELNAAISQKTNYYEKKNLQNL